MGPEEVLFLFSLGRGEAGGALVPGPGRLQGPARHSRQPGVEQGEGGEGVLSGAGAEGRQQEQETGGQELHAAAATRTHPASPTFF